MDMKNLFPRFLFMIISIILFSLGFYGNQWRAVEMEDLQHRRDVNELLVFGRLVESRNNGIFSHGGLLGIGDVSEWNLEQHVIDNQTRKYLKGTGFTSFWLYKSQPGLQGIVYSAIDRLTDFAPSTNIVIFRSLISLALALILSGICYWSLLEFGWTAAISVAGFILMSKYLALLGGNLFWSLWSYYFPFLVLSLLLRRVGGKDEYTSTKRFVAVVYFLSMIKILFGGFDFITPGLLMLTVPLVYYAVLNAWKWNAFLRGLINMGMGFAGAILTGLILLGSQIRVDAGSYEAALSHIVYSLEKRTYGLDATNNEVSSSFLAEVHRTMDVVWMYLNSYAFSLSNRFSINSAFIRDLIDGRYLFLVVLFTLFAVLFIVKFSVSKNLNGYWRGRALIIATGYSVIAPLSWMVIFRDHAGTHTTLDSIIWQMPFTLYGFALVGYVVATLIKYPQKAGDFADSGAME